MKENTIKGTYKYLNRRFIPDDNMEFINRKVKTMLYALGSETPSSPAVYYDKEAKQYWQCWEYIDHSKELTPVTREYIERKYPKVNCDDLVELDYLGPDDPVPEIYGELKPQKKQEPKFESLSKVAGFDALADYIIFKGTLEDMLQYKLLEKREVTSRYRDSSILKEEWYYEKSSQITWRLVAPDYPFEGIFEPVSD